VSIAVPLLLLGECLQIASRPRSQADVPNRLTLKKRITQFFWRFLPLPETADEEMKFHLCNPRLLERPGVDLLCLRSLEGRRKYGYFPKVRNIAIEARAMISVAVHPTVFR
jgi:hypothetical protein